jgi:hypothetical protein
MADFIKAQERKNEDGGKEKGGRKTGNRGLVLGYRSP